MQWAQAKQLPVPKLRELKDKLTKDWSQIRDNKLSDEERGFQADNIGPFRVASTNGAKHFAIFVDVKENFTYQEIIPTICTHQYWSI